MTQSEFHKRLTTMLVVPAMLNTQKLITERHRQIRASLGRKERDPVLGDYFYDKVTKRIFYFTDKWFEVSQHPTTISGFLELVSEVGEEFHKVIACDPMDWIYHTGRKKQEIEKIVVKWFGEKKSV